MKSIRKFSVVTLLTALLLCSCQTSESSFVSVKDGKFVSTVAFSRFFRQRTGRTLSEYIVDIRLGYAARMLVDSSRNISEICYECGFNNLSNFNRTFKTKRHYTPREFRAMFKKNKVIV